MEKQIDTYNAMDDYTLFLTILSTRLSLEEKKFIFNNCSTRLEKMEENVYLQMIRQLEILDILGLSEYIYNKVKGFSQKQLEKVLYVNKYYHELSDLAEYLCKQEWFINDKKATSFLVGYSLEKMIKEEDSDKEIIKSIGRIILDEFSSSNNNVELEDMILKNYFCLLEKNCSEMVEDFVSNGYEKIDRWIAKEQKVTPNMIIFLCHALKRKLDLDCAAEFFNFVNKPNEWYFAYFHANEIIINIAAVSKAYEKFGNENVAFLYLLSVLGHELGHAYVMEHRAKTDRGNLMDNLLLHNACVSSALQNLESKEFYRKYHNCFSHEFYANIAGLETLYNQYERFPSLTKEAKVKINELLACNLYSSYAMDSETASYLGSVDFVRRFFDDYKNNLPGYAKMLLLDGKTELPGRLVEVEKSLNDEEKFKLGYHNKYIGILEMIARGEIKTTNILEDLPYLYQEYGYLVEGKYPAHSDKKEESSKMM